MTKAQRLRELIKRDQVTLACGVYDGLSAFLAERAGFDALWASGYCISASKRLADVGLVTMTEHLLATAEIDKASSLPVIADVDDGFGDAVNVSRMVREYEAAGIAAICLEDNRHPKRSSLYAGVNRDLVSQEEFSGKIRAAKEFQTTKDFVVIARTEALVADLGVPEALSRARAYGKAGADMVLVHCKDPKPDLMMEFSKHWDMDIPLVAVPTTYYGVKTADLNKAGYKIVILANQGLRSAVTAMDRTFRQMVRDQGSATVESQISPLSEISSIVGLERTRDIESRFSR